MDLGDASGRTNASASAHDRRERARSLRLQGATCAAIAAELGVSASSVASWVRDLPRPAYDYSKRPQCTSTFLARLTAERRERAERVRREQKARAAAEVGELSDRELLLVGAALYWAEGAKDKPWARSERVRFINSDPDMITVFLRWLDLLGVGPDKRNFRVQIHETADVERALAFWSRLVGVPASDFLKTTLKRSTHDPKRRNLGDDYRGCLIVQVRKSSTLYRQIDGWWRGIAHASPALAEISLGYMGQSGLD